MKINVLSEIGPRCIVADDGQQLHDKVLGPLQSGDNVYLDFLGVRQFASPFFNYFIGQLMNELTQDELRQLLHLENLTDVGRVVMNQVIENAARFKGNEDYAKIVDDILARHSGGDRDAG